MTYGRHTRTLLLIATLVGALAACRETASSPDGASPPYLAIINKFDAPPAVNLGDEYEYRIQAITEGAVIDTVVRGSPTDTVVVPVPTGNYVVRVAGLPDRCFTRDGDSQDLLIPEGTNTGIVRFYIICSPSLRLSAVSQGGPADGSYVYRITGPGGTRLGVLAPNDTITLPDMPGGDYTVELGDVAPNCAVVSSGGERVDVAISDSVQGSVEFQVFCGDPASAPVILDAQSRAVGSLVTIALQLRDPERDVDRVTWELTDCKGRPVGVPQRLRTKLTSTRAATREVGVVLSVFDTPLPQAELLTRCSRMYALDRVGNVSRVVEVPVSAAVSVGGPVASTFNAVIVGGVLTTILNATDDDLLGFFPILRLRDGVIGEADGRPDIGVLGPAGFIDTDLPPVPVGDGTRLNQFDIQTMEVYMFDRAGHVSVATDRFLFE